MLKGDAPIEELLTARKRMPGGVTYMAVQSHHQLAIELFHQHIVGDEICVSGPCHFK
jgi:hypothetical protein